VGAWRKSLTAALVALALAGAPAAAEPPAATNAGGAGAADPARAEALGLCRTIHNAAWTYRLPPEFFARLLWKESRFDPRAVSPKGAQGVAQFMPATAQRRGLDDPFDPAQAIPASAAYLAELRGRFGNLGLAAAAYNGGEDRVEAWLGGNGGLAGETLAYVQAITFRPASWFREDGREVEPRPLAEGRGFLDACTDLSLGAARGVLYAGAAWQPWGVDLAVNPSYDRAMARYARTRARFGKILGGHEPMVTQRRLGRGRQTIWSVGVGMPTRVAAFQLCDRLREAGGACVVRRN